MSIPVLVVSGSSRDDSHLRRLCDLAAQTAAAAGAEVRRLDLDVTRLPVMIHGDPAQALLPEVRLVRELADWARAFVIGTPEYHGNMSGTLKNWFDFLYPELGGKLAAVMASTGGGSGDMSIAAVKTTFQWCHGFTLPFHVAARNADFSGDELVNQDVASRVRRIAYDVVRYGALLDLGYREAKNAGRGEEAGFAGLSVE